MITYKNSTEVSISQLYEAFCLGFSDYLLPLSMKEEEFVAHFLGPEGNRLECSFIAMDEDHPIGLILGGIRNFDGLKTMRCGALCLAPQYRGKGISNRLFEMHKAAAEEAGCKQLFLEVITENNRAVKFYENLDYRRSATLKYYTGTVANIPSPKTDVTYQVTKLTYNIIRDFRDALRACHINWQCDTPYYENNKNDAFWGMFDNDRMIALIAMNTRGKMNFLWVEPDYRLKGIGHHLVLYAIKQQGVERVSVTVAGNAILEGFLRKMQFQPEKLEQYEMYLPL